MAETSLGPTGPTQKKGSVYRSLHAGRITDLNGVQLAPFHARLIAFFLDISIVVVIIALARVPEILKAVSNKENLAVEINPFHGWEVAALVAYFGIVTYLGKGRTLGKRIMRIRVVSLTHDHLSFWHSLERSLGYCASFLEGGFGFIQYFIHPNRQTVHDRIAETIVVRELKAL